MNKIKSILEKKWSLIVEFVMRPSGFVRARYMVRKFADYLNKDETLLDLGCGPGHLSVALAEDHHLKVTMVDTKPHKGFIGMWLGAIPCAKILSQKFNLKYQFYDGKKLDCDEGAYDNVLLSFVCHHAKEPEELLIEAIRIAKKKVFLLEEIHRNKLDEFLNPKIDRLVTFDWFGYENRRFTEKQLHKIFKRFQLKIVHTKSWGNSLFPMRLFILEKTA